jgi:hypothetical protein
VYRIKRIVALALLLLVIGAGTPQVFADDGPTETPGNPVPGPTPPQIPGPTETPGIINGLIIFIVSTITH